MFLPAPAVSSGFLSRSCSPTSPVSVRHVLLQVAVGGAPLSELCGVGQVLPAAVFLAAHTLGATQVGQTFGRRSLLRVLGRATVGSLRAGVVKVVPQVL